jgi:hypothetical protein
MAGEEATVTKRKTKSTVAALMKAATKAAKKVGNKGNWIRVDTKGDRSGVVLTTVIGGDELAWITFEAEQLDELIRLLESSRRDLP